MQILLENFPRSLARQREQIARCLNAFAASVPVRKVYLFGSHSRGEASRESDVDLCIVAEGVDSQLAASRRLRRATRDIRPKPAFTLVPISPERLEEKRRRKDPFFESIMKEGVLIASED